MYAHVTVEIRFGKIDRFFELMAQAVPITEEVSDWRLCRALVQESGRLFTVIHIWEMPDANAFAEGKEKIYAHPDAPRLIEQLSEIAESETIVLAAPTPYCPVQ